MLALSALSSTIPTAGPFLGITAVGLIAFGLFQIGEGAYRRITPPRIA